VRGRIRARRRHASTVTAEGQLQGNGSGEAGEPLPPPPERVALAAPPEDAAGRAAEKERPTTTARSTSQPSMADRERDLHELRPRVAKEDYESYLARCSRSRRSSSFVQFTTTFRRVMGGRA
jgi:hypothetical protein